MTHQRAGVDFRRYGDAVLTEKMLSALFRAPVACDRGKLTDHQTFDERTDGFLVGLVRSVVTDLRIRQDHDLTGVGGVGEYLLIACDGGVEHHLAQAVFVRTKAPSLEDRPVFQGEQCLIQVRLSSRSFQGKVLYYSNTE